MAADGSITFDTDLDNKTLEKKLQQAKREVEKLEKKLTKQSSDKSMLERQFSDAADAADKASARADELRHTIAEMQKELDGAGASKKMMSPERFIELRENIESAKPKLEEAVKEAERLGDECLKSADKCTNIGVSIAETEEDLIKAKENAGGLAQQLLAAEGKTDNTAKNLKKVGEKAGEAAKQLEVASKNGGKLSLASEKVEKKMGRFSRRIKEIIKSALIFSVLTRALSGVRDWFGRVVKSNDAASAALGRLKGALLTLIQPLVNVALPAFTAFINVLTRVVTVAASAISALFGVSLNQSKKAAEQLNAEAASLGDVGKAAKSAAGNMASFDELNVISDNSSGAEGKAADSSISPDFDFDVVPLSDKLKGILAIVIAIGAAFLAWKFSSLFTSNLKILAGIALVVGGVVLLGLALKDAFENGFTLQNTLLAIIGLLGIGLGLFLLTGSFIPLIIAAVAGLLLAITVATGHGGELIEGLKEILAGFKDFFVGIFSGDIEKAISGLENIFEGLKKAVGAVIDGIRDFFINFLTWLDEKTGGKFHGIIESLKNDVMRTFGIVKDFIFKNIDAVKKIFSGLTEFLAGVFSGDFEKALDGIKKILAGALNGIITTIEFLINSIINGINFLIGKLNLIHFDVPDGVPLIGGEDVGFNIPLIPKLEIPRLAQGAVIPANREFLAVLGDQKNGVNIETPLDTMIQAFRTALAESGYNGEIVLNNVLTLDGEVVYRNQERIKTKRGTATVLNGAFAR